jgi:hypothetical protein
MATISSITEILERVKVREVAGAFRSRDALDEAVSALLSSGSTARISMSWSAQKHAKDSGAQKSPLRNCRICRRLPGSPSSHARMSSWSGRSSYRS